MKIPDLDPIYHHWSEEFELLVSLYHAVIETKDLPSAFNATLQIVCEFAGWDLGLAWIPAPGEKELKLSSAWHRGDREPAEFVRVCQDRPCPPDVSMAGRIWKRQKPEWTFNLAAEPSALFPLAPDAAKAGIKAALGVPVLHGNTVFAVLAFYMFETKEKDNHLVQVVSEVAAHLGFALYQKDAEEKLRKNEALLWQAREELVTRVQEQTAELRSSNQALQAEVAERRRIQEELSTRVRQQAAVSQMGQIALSGAELSEVLGEACALVARTLGVEFCKVLELLPDGKTLRLCAGVGWKDGLVGRATVSTQFHSQAGYTLLSAAPVVVEDLRTETRFSGPPLLHDHGVVSGMSVMIPGREGPFGVLGAHTRRARVFNGDDVHFLESIANVICQALIRDLSEQTLRESEAQSRRAFEFNQAIMANMSEGLYTVDERGLVTYVNPTAERLFGWSSAELIGRKMHDMTHYKHSDGTPFPADECPGLQVLRDGKVLVNCEDAFIRKDGTLFEVLYSSSPIRLDNRIAGLTVVFRDVTAEKRAEKEIQRSAAWLQSLIDTTQDAVLSIDRQGQVVLFNPAAARIFGYTRNEIVGQKVNVLMGEPYAKEHDGYIERYERTGEARAIGRIRTVTARRKNGELFPIELSVTKIAEDQEVHYAAFIRDISEKTRLQEQLVENERLVAIGTTAAKIGHELANPLNGMSLTIQLLEQRLSKRSNLVDTQITSTVNRLHNEVTRLSTLLEQFRSLSRREKFDFQRTTLAALVDEAIEIELPRYAELGIQVECSFPSNLPAITVDIDKMKQVIFNLTKNAVEAMAGGGKISIKGSTSDDRVLLEISDTGTGIPPGIDIFEPFFTTKPQGTGLGLSIVQQVVNAHGGSMTYSSEHGKGTTFVIALPQN